MRTFSMSLAILAAVSVHAQPAAFQHGESVRVRASSAENRAAIALKIVAVPGDRIRAVGSNRIAYRDGVAISAMEGDYLRPLAEMDEVIAIEAATALAGRKVPVASGFVGR